MRNGNYAITLLQSTPGLDYTYSRYPGEYIDGQYCNTCQTGQHRIENTIDEDEDNWWQSSSLATIPDYNQKMNIELFLGQVFSFSMTSVQNDDCGLHQSKCKVF